MRVEEFDYHLPREAIAQKPHTPRDKCRLLVLHKDGKIEHKIFRDIIDYINPEDMLVINTTRVIPARLIGKKEDTGGKAEVFLLNRIDKTRWECLLKPSRRIKQGQKIVFPQGELEAKVVQKKERNAAVVELKSCCPLEESLYSVGQVPLPPYIKRKKGPTCQDKGEYQTVYAKKPGAVAAPTAGLHFTPSLLSKIKQKGTQIVEIILHTGWASFFSLDSEKVEENSLPGEYFKIPAPAAEKINRCKKQGGKIVAVGTTTVRALETNSSETNLHPGEGWTELFIYPGYKFKMVDALITNFHMPRSSLLMLICALAGKEKTNLAYQEALTRDYRFLSYGDAMFII